MGHPQSFFPPLNLLAGAYGRVQGLPYALPGVGAQQQGYPGLQSPPKAKSYEILPSPEDLLKEELRAVLKHINGRFKELKTPRKIGLEALPKQPGKSKPKSQIMEGKLQSVEMTAADGDLYLYLSRYSLLPEVPFDHRVRPWVERKFPGFYQKYKNPQDLQKALNDCTENVWTTWES